MENEIDLIYLWKILSRRKRIIIWITIVAIILASIYAFAFMETLYEASVSIIIGKEEAKYFLEDRYTVSDVSLYIQVAKTYEEIAQSAAVYQRTKGVLQDADFDQITSVKAASKPGTQVLTVSVVHPLPDKAVIFANAVAENFLQVASEVLPAGELNILDKAESARPASTSKIMIIVIGAILGVAFSSGMILLMEYINKNIECEEDVKRYLNLPVLGDLPNLDPIQ